MNRAAKRLAAYLNECLSRARRGGRYWLRLPLAEFMRATGYAERTARAAWAQVRDLFESRLVRRGRSHVSMIALQGTLSPCNPQYKGGIPSELEKRNITEHAPKPARTKFSFGRARVEQAAKQRDPLRRLAAWFAWRLGRCHWDACRVRFNPGFAHAYAAKAFALGYDRASVEAAYESALRDEHVVASDVGRASWRPFRLMGLALKRLSQIGPDWVRPAAPIREPETMRIAPDAFADFCASIAPDPFDTYQPYARAV